MQVTENSEGVRIELSGFADTILALSAVDPDLRKGFFKALRNTGVVVAGTASRSAPPRHPGSKQDMRAGYKVQMRNLKTTTIVKVRNDTAPGNILEFAGSKSSGKTQQGRSLIANLTQEYGKPGRFMWAAYDMLAPWIADQVTGVAEDAERALQQRLDGVDA